MPFTSGLVASGRALGYVAHASVPTVTMPRLKALVTGKAPAFIDILKNFNSAALDEEANLVSLLAASGKRIVFYGDDTWLKLFPNSFKRSDGTSGFYTRDTVEVDNNVTRHLNEELDPTMKNEKSGDWDALVLHYLGLDHVGHLRGPRSPLMRDKLKEMDNVVQQVVNSVREQDSQRMEKDNAAKSSLILLCSDHGMSEVGNHGGATLEESSALLMFLRGDGEPMHSSDISYKQKRSQVDLVPTISSLFGLPIPLYSTGLLLDDVVRASSSPSMHHGSFYWRALYRNFQQLYGLAKIKFHASTLASFDMKFELPLNKLHERLQKNKDGAVVDQQTAAAILEACEVLQAKVLQSDGSEYNSAAIFSGLALLFFSGGAALIMMVNAVKVEASTKLGKRISHLFGVLSVGSILQIASLSSSSSIENEHATVFFMTTTLLVAVGIIFLKLNKVSNDSSHLIGIVGLLLVLTRILRARNQVINFWRLNGLDIDTNLAGNEFATDDSVSILSTAPVLPSNVLPLSFCVIMICGVVLRKSVHYTRTALQKKAVLQFAVGVSSGILFVVGMLACLRVKECSDQAVAEEIIFKTRRASLNTDTSARLVYACVVLLAVLMALAGRSLQLLMMEKIIWLLVGLLQRSSNFPTLCVLCLQMEIIAKLLQYEQATAFRHSCVVLAGLSLWVSQSAFFALGNSHLVTTIDISQSYHGLSSYSQSLVGALTFVSVFSGPLVCFVNLFQWLDASPKTAATVTGPTTQKVPNTRRTACLAIFTYQTLRFAVYAYVVCEDCCSFYFILTVRRFAAALWSTLCASTCSSGVSSPQRFVKHSLPVQQYLTCLLVSFCRCSTSSRTLLSHSH
ncbi:hypothetical protein PHMEG_00068 [Phytophthora megakarya]|uniref:GPI ethanolamine phosphate transferase 2 C-terminal domain-containing protein n=1 Tax=Phytophthora megakarya TaxID=4795 RepID=A0A225X692_9STRA|nr:hypothetical protein PHMEG_00068 [Phytophthora megakarya]